MQDELIEQVAWVGQSHVRGPARAIVLRFGGLGATALKSGADPTELIWGEAGGLIVYPYHEPWAWMNKPTREFVDELVDALGRRVGKALPVIATGGSMGGHAALAYAMDTRQRIAAVWCNSPVCDLPYHYTERPDLPRTMHHAFGSYDDIRAALALNSPVHHVEKLPDVPYFIIHGMKDKSVNKAKHSDVLVPLMRKRHLHVTYLEAPEMEHCGPMTLEQWRTSTEFVSNILRTLKV